MARPGPIGYWGEIFKHSIGRYESREKAFSLIGVLLLALGYGAYFQDDALIRIAGAVATTYFLLQLTVFGPWRLWDEAQKRIAEYQDRLQPRISFVLHQNTPPYVHHFKATEDVTRILHTVRICRIGLRNDSSVIIPDVRVVIESMVWVRGGTVASLTPHHPVDIEQALNVMGIDTKNGRVDLSPGDLPTAYIDVVEQRSPGNRIGSSMSPCYASGHRTTISALGTWALRLRVEGGGTYSRENFFVTGSETQGIILEPFDADPFASVTEKAASRSDLPPRSSEVGD